MTKLHSGDPLMNYRLEHAPNDSCWSCLMFALLGLPEGCHEQIPRTNSGGFVCFENFHVRLLIKRQPEFAGIWGHPLVSGVSFFQAPWGGIIFGGSFMFGGVTCPFSQKKKSQVSSGLGTSDMGR